MATLKSRAGAARLGAPLMILSFLMVAGFIYWLSVTAEPTEIAVVDPGEELVNVVTLAEFSVEPGSYLGQVVSLRDIAIGDPLGNHARWLTLEDENRNGYVLHFADSLRADTTVALSSLTGGMAVSLTGVVTETTDSILDVWDAAGAFDVALDKILPMSVPHLNFLEVTRIVLPEQSESGDDDSSGSDEDNGS